jgi:hypothetical protein
MKNFTLSRKILAFAMFSMLSCGLNAQIFSENFDSFAGKGGNDTTWGGISGNSEATLDNWTFTNCYSGSQCLLVGKSKGTGIATTPILTGLSGTATLTFKAGAWTKDATTLVLSVVGGGTIDPATVTLVNGEFTSYTATITGGTAASQISFTGSAATYNRFFLDDVVLTSGGTVVVVSSPTFSLVTGTYTGAQSVTLSTKTDGASIYYTTDGTNPTSASTLYTAPINIDATTTINAISVKGSDVSSMASATYTINYSKTVTSVTDLLKETATSEGAPYVLSLAQSSPMTLLFLSGTNAYFVQNGSPLLIYGTTPLTDASITDPGTQIYGDFTGTYMLYNSAPEFSLSSATNITKLVNVVTVTPEEVTLADLNANLSSYVNKLVTIKGATATSASIVANGTNTATLYDKFKIGYSDLTVDSKYDITGFVVNYKGAVEIYPRSTDDIKTAATSINNITTDNLTITSKKGGFVINAGTPQSIKIYTLAGQLVKSIVNVTGEKIIDLPSGLYIINGKKAIAL